MLPADLTLLFKALISLEGLGRQYDPEFRLVERVKPFLDRAMSERYQPAEAMRRGQATLSDFFGLVTSVPRDLARLVKDARQGRMRVDLDLKRLDSFGDRLDRAIDRVTIGVMTASLVIGSSIVMTVPGGPTVFGMSLLTLFGLARLSDRIREQSLDHPLDLALRPALTASQRSCSQAQEPWHAEGEGYRGAHLRSPASEGGLSFADQALALAPIARRVMQRD